MSSLDEELSELFNSNKEAPEVKFPYFYVNLCKLSETLIYKPLIDSNGVPFRVITGIRQGSIEIDGQNFSFRIPDRSNFKNLTEGQAKLVDEIHKQLDIYCNAHPDSWMFKPTKTTVVSFGSVIKLGEVTYNKFTPSVIVVNSARYIGFLQKFIQELTKLSGKEVINNLFSRSNSFDRLLSIKAERKDQFGYQFNFDLHYDISGELPQEVIDRADSIYSEYIDVNNFNEEIYDKALKGLVQVNGKSI